MAINENVDVTQAERIQEWLPKLQILSLRP